MWVRCLNCCWLLVLKLSTCPEISSCADWGLWQSNLLLWAHSKWSFLIQHSLSSVYFHVHLQKHPLHLSLNRFFRLFAWNLVRKKQFEKEECLNLKTEVLYILCLTLFIPFYLCLTYCECIEHWCVIMSLDLIVSSHLQVWGNALNS